MTYKLFNVRTMYVFSFEKHFSLLNGSHNFSEITI